MPTIKTFHTLSELTEDQQKAYIMANPDKFTDDYEWWDSTLEDYTEILEKVGFRNVDIYFSGFGSQGDGAHFTGSYSYQKGALKLVEKEYPNFKELHDLVGVLQDLERLDFYQIHFKITSSGRYSHEMATNFNFEDHRHHYGFYDNTEREEEYKEVCRNFMHYIYHSLEKEYEHLSSVEYRLDDINDGVYDYIEVEETELTELTA